MCADTVSTGRTPRSSARLLAGRNVLCVFDPYARPFPGPAVTWVVYTLYTCKLTAQG